MLTDIQSAEAGAALELPPESSSRQLRVRTLKIVGAKLATVILALAAMIGLWQAIVTIFHLPVVELPGPGPVFSSLDNHIGFLLRNAGVTFTESAIGYLLAVVIAIPLGVALSHPGRIATALNTGALSAQIFPKIAVAPLFALWFGFGPLPKYLFVFLLAFFPIMLNTTAGFAGVPQEIHDLGYIIGLRTFGQLRKLQGPWALPQIFAGLKISASFAVTAAIVFEFVGAESGLGVVISTSQNNLDVTLMFAALVLTAVIGFLFYGVVAGIEGLAIPWHVSKRRKR